MNWIVARLKEPSTKRGIIWLIAGIAVLCGYELSPEKIEQWIGIAMMVAGLMGWLPDEKQKVVESGRVGDARPVIPGGDSTQRRAVPDSGRSDVADPVRLSESVPAERQSQPEPDTQQSGWNG